MSITNEKYYNTKLSLQINFEFDNYLYLNKDLNILVY